MLPDISEFSYGFVLVNELINYYTLQLAGAPRFPTQNEEGQTGGYDVLLPRPGAPIFLQIKRSDCMRWGNAAQADDLGVPHYRMHLRPRRHSRQHELLLDLEASYPEVYYAAPRFHTPDELDTAYRANAVGERSTLIKPSQIGWLPDDRDHHVAISADGSRWLFCSRKSRELHAVQSAKVLREDFGKAARVRSKRVDAAYLNGLADEMLDKYVTREVRAKISPDELTATVAELAPERRALVEEVKQREFAVRRKAHEVRARGRPAEYAREVAHALLGCELLFVLAD